MTHYLVFIFLVLSVLCTSCSAVQRPAEVQRTGTPEQKNAVDPDRRSNSLADNGKTLEMIVGDWRGKLRLSLPPGLKAPKPRNKTDELSQLHVESLVGNNGAIICWRNAKGCSRAEVVFLSAGTGELKVNSFSASALMLADSQEVESVESAVSKSETGISWIRVLKLISPIQPADGGRSTYVSHMRTTLLIESKNRLRVKEEQSDDGKIWSPSSEIELERVK